jgi:hypothetical protein
VAAVAGPVYETTVGARPTGRSSEASMVAGVAMETSSPGLAR